MKEVSLKWVEQLEAGEVHIKTNVKEIRGTTLSILSGPEGHYNNTIRLLSENRQHPEETKDRIKELLRENAKLKCFMNEIFSLKLAISTDPENLKNNVIKLLVENKQFTKDDENYYEKIQIKHEQFMMMFEKYLTFANKKSKEITLIEVLENFLKVLSENEEFSAEEKTSFKKS
ncbi:1133_t:CDS:2 [Dentiscutata erythropus]|uniref:1133_t:CDS:1 n=1 Tax=Dentiscutata erythropus TaxID=1348616 RepID=A0A9N9AT17_9GLOM|nr:1133_t:CDS:2 [Dentiscutata erythropus]